MPSTTVFRSFPNETVVLNLTTGRYHGLNPSAGRMLEAMTSEESLAEAARVIAAEYATPLETIETDICGLCQVMLERGLIEVGAGNND